MGDGRTWNILVETKQLMLSRAVIIDRPFQIAKNNIHLARARCLVSCQSLDTE